MAANSTGAGVSPSRPSSARSSPDDVAELAMVSLEESDEVFGQRIHDLRALGWAWLGNAHRLALDLSAGEAAFEKADKEWGMPKAPQASLVAGKIYLLKGTLRMFQRSYPDALELVDRARSLFRFASDLQGEAQTLIQRAAILGYSGKPEDSITALESAGQLIGESDQTYLSYVVAANMATDHAKLGN